MKAFVLAPGPSLTLEQVELVKAANEMTYAVSDSYRMAPWADVLVSSDAVWWAERSAARSFAGRRFAAVDASHLGVERVPDVPSGMNSGLVALRLAVLFGATQVVLLGIDMQGTHFFGEHKYPLTNTSESQFEDMQKQFEDFRPEGVDVVNVSPSSALRAYRRARLEEVL